MKRSYRAIRSRLRRIYDRIFFFLTDTLGFDRWWRAPHQKHTLDEKLEKYLDFQNGVFVELGANDGFTQSNTRYLEEGKGWSGVLVEPIPELYKRAKRRRRKAKTYQSACVPFGFSQDAIEVMYANLMSYIPGALKDTQTEQKHLDDAVRVQKNIQPYLIKVPARTLTSILIEAQITQIDFLSLDVEGFEADVLRGLDFERFAPRFMLIEARFADDVEAVLGERYDLVEQMAKYDRFYRRLAK